MDNSLLIILFLCSATIFISTIVSVLLLIFSSGKKTIIEEANYQNLSKQRMRNRKVANKAAEAYLILQEEC